MAEQTLTKSVTTEVDPPDQNPIENKPTQDMPGKRSLPAFLQQEKLEPILVVVTALAIAASLILEKTQAPSQLVLVANIISYISGGWFGLQAGVKSLLEREINVDLLMVLAAIGAALVNDWREGATLLFLFSLSNVLQAYAIDRSRNAIRALLKLRPNEATLRQGNALVVVPVETLKIGDVVVIHPGERMPIDGQITDGESTVDQSPITGESMPVTKTKGDDVFAGTVNQNGSLDVKVTHTANDSTLARIIKMVEDAQGRRAATQRFLDEFEQKYALFVIVGVILFIVIPPLIPGGPDFASNFYRAMVLMTVLSPCALVISTPASILSAIANAARRGILFKGGVHLEQMTTIKAIAFDKTGTITTGKPAVTDVVPFDQQNNNIATTTRPYVYQEAMTRLLMVAALAEFRSEHPIGQAVVKHAQEKIPDQIKEKLATELPQDHFEAIPGHGVKISPIKGEGLTLVGTERLMTAENITLPAAILSERNRLESEGKTTLLVYDQASGGWLGILAVADQVRPNAAQILKSLRQAGIERIVILTGDNERVGSAVAKQVGADEVRAGLLPDQKVEAIKALQTQYGSVAMVGDGVNDAPALAVANIGIAMGAAGTDVALETADVVLMSDDLSKIAYAMHLSRQARRVVYQNLAFALGVICILAISALGLNLPLPFGVVGHEGSTLIVVTNGLRLLTYRGPTILP